MASWKLALRRPRRPILYSTRNHRNYTPLRWQDQPPRNYIRFLFWATIRRGGNGESAEEGKVSALSAAPGCMHCGRRARLPRVCRHGCRHGKLEACATAAQAPGFVFNAEPPELHRFGGKINHQETNIRFLFWATIRRGGNGESAEEGRSPRSPRLRVVCIAGGAPGSRGYAGTDAGMAELGSLRYGGCQAPGFVFNAEPPELHRFGGKINHQETNIRFLFWATIRRGGRRESAEALLVVSTKSPCSSAPR